MNNLVKYLGVIILLVGVAILAVPSFMGTSSNGVLVAGLACVIAGFIGHIFINNRVQ